MEVVLIEIPNTKGYEQHGIRPALLLSRPIKEISIIIPFTSNLLAMRFPFSKTIEPSLENGLTSNSILLIFQIRAIDSKRIKKTLGMLETKYEDDIKSQLKMMLNLNID